ncbi:uncharacterized protein LOC126373736 [Pectinophora gossypiella]|uniref:uncharacterized protein LOC126373736 n=1 Tax=Pectinophora gossypiella TaxID=13191 RepID=UPI00214E5CE7|nr:uncharacterized protein LOC126373736 [Pectinophora gossypiella]
MPSPKSPISHVKKRITLVYSNLFTGLLIAYSVLVHGAHKPNKVWEFEIDLPKMLRTLRSYTGVSVTSSPSLDPNVEGPIARYGQPDLLSQKLKFEISSPGLAHIMDYVKNLVSARRQNKDQRQKTEGYVMEIQGVIKTPKYTYPPDYDWMRLSSLYKIKQEKENKKG